MISLAITTFNRSGFTVESFIEVLDCEYIDEIVIVDDNSNPVIYENLRKLVMRLNHKKVRLYRNKATLGVFRNKIRAAKLCSNDWVILFDSDNVIRQDYINTIQELKVSENVLYCPERLMDVGYTKAQWEYPELCDVTIDRFNVGSYVDNINYEIHINTGNSFFHRKTFLDVVAHAEIPDEKLKGCDSSYIVYLWLLNGGLTQVVKGLSYSHRVHEGSYYAQHIAEGTEFNSKIYQMMRELNPPRGGFVVSKNFWDIAKTSYDYNEKVIKQDPRWLLLEEMYNKNFLEIENPHTNVLPKKIHQIWLGGTIPDKYKRLADTWHYCNPDWEYKLWTDADIANMDLPNRRLFDSMTNYGPKSDLLRYYLMNEYGGVYADTDFECLRSFYAFNHLEYFTGISYQSKMELYPGLIGCIPHHPISEKLIEEVKKIQVMPKDSTGVLETISSYFFTRVFFSMIKSYTENIVAFPTAYFYPFPNERGHMKRDGRVYIKDCSYALHHWAVSWLK